MGDISVAKALISALIDDFNIPAENIIYVGSDLGMVERKVQTLWTKDLLRMLILKNISLELVNYKEEFLLNQYLCY